MTTGSGGIGRAPDPRAAMRRRRVSALVAAVCAAGLVGCSAGSAPLASSSETPTPSQASSPAASSPAASNTTGVPAPASASATPTSSATASPARPGAAPSRTPAATATAQQIVARSTIPILCYHRIRDVTAQDGPVSRSITTPPATFADQIAALKKAGYRTITPEQLRAHLLTGETLPAKSVLLTFDDGSKGQWAAAGPVLKKAGYVATYFVMTVVLGKPDWLTDADLRAMRAAGMTIGSHTWDHHDVRDYTAADWTVQLDGSLARLAKASGGPVTTFAYPYGAWNDAAIAPIAARHVGLAFQLLDKPVSPQAPLLTQRRMLVDGRWSGKTLLAHLRTAFPKA